MRQIIVIVLLLLFPTFLVADEKPTWEITKYLHGTTEEVRDQLNGELERQLTRVDDIQQQIATCKQGIHDKEAEALEVTRTLPNYLELKAQRDKADRELKEARANRDIKEQMDASARYNHARLAIEKMEKDAPVKYIDAIELREKLKGYEESLANVNGAVETSRKWRNELIDAIRFTYAPREPLLEGGKAFVGKAKCDSVLGANSAVLIVDVTLSMQKVGEAEGLATIDTRYHRVQFLVGGIDTSGMREGREVILDRTVSIVGSRMDTDFRTMYLARADHSKVDDLLSAIIPLRTPDEVRRRRAATKPVTLKN